MRFGSSDVSQGARRAAIAGGFPDGAAYHRDYFDEAGQRALLAAVSGILQGAPPFQPVMPRTGKPFSVVMSNCGPLGWVSDRAGYRYQPCHLQSGAPWPPMPGPLVDLWRNVSGAAVEPEACLINFYAAGAKMGTHQDRDEADLDCPVVSVSLGDDAVFHIGGTTRAAPKKQITLHSGDVLVMGGTSRLAFHGIDRLRPGTSNLDLGALHPGCRRINLTLRRVTLGT